MKTVEQLAREAGFMSAEFWPDDFKGLHATVTRFHDLAIAQYRESLLAGVGEPDYTDSALYEPTAYTRDKVAAAVAIEREIVLSLVNKYAKANMENDNVVALLDHLAAAIRGQP